MIYFIIGMFVLFLLLLHNSSNSKNLKGVLFYCGGIALFILFALRGQMVGGDTFKYVTEFAMNSYRDREWGYVLFCDLIKIFGTSPFVYIFFSSAISIIPFLLLAKKYGENSLLSIFYIFCFPSVIVCLETNIRQNIGTGLLIIGFLLYQRYKERSKYFLIPPILLLIWGTLCHTSFYYITPLCIVINFIRVKKKIAYILLLTTFILGGLSNQYIESVFQYIYMYIEGIESLSRIYAYSDTRNLGNFIEASFYIYRILFLIWTILVVSSMSVKDENNYFLKSFVVYACLYNFGTSSDLMYRIFFAIQIFSFVFTPQKMFKDHVRIGVFSGLSLIWIRQLFILCTDPTKQNLDAFMFPYLFIWE